MKEKQIIKELAIEIGTIAGYEYWIVPSPNILLTKKKKYNGYVVFPKKPVREDGYEGILTYVPVHGGITYADKFESGMVYGFDTLHIDSEKYPIENKEWIKKQCKIMLKGILKAKEVEKKYLQCLTNKCKAKYAQMVQEINPNKKERHNFGISINLLSGKL